MGEGSFHQNEQKGMKQQSIWECNGSPCDWVRTAHNSPSKIRQLSAWTAS